VALGSWVDVRGIAICASILSLLEDQDVVGGRSKFNLVLPISAGLWTSHFGTFKVHLECLFEWKLRVVAGIDETEPAASCLRQRGHFVDILAVIFIFCKVKLTLIVLFRPVLSKLLESLCHNVPAIVISYLGNCHLLWSVHIEDNLFVKFIPFSSFIPAGVNCNHIGSRLKDSVEVD
jgi:hypothetical protein